MYPIPFIYSLYFFLTRFQYSLSMYLLCCTVSLCDRTVCISFIMWCKIVCHAMKSRNAAMSCSIWYASPSAHSLILHHSIPCTAPYSASCIIHIRNIIAPRHCCDCLSAHVEHSQLYSDWCYHRWHWDWLVVSASFQQFSVTRYASRHVVWDTQSLMNSYVERM